MVVAGVDVGSNVDAVHNWSEDQLLAQGELGPPRGRPPDGQSRPDKQDGLEQWTDQRKAPADSSRAGDFWARLC